MSFPSRSQYFADRAASSRQMRDAAIDSSIAYAHDGLAEVYQAASNRAKAAEARPTNLERNGPEQTTSAAKPDEAVQA